MAEEKGASWADPGFIGLMALAAGVASLWPILVGIIPKEGVPLVIGWMLVTGIALIICGVICLRVGNAIVGAPCIVFGAVINCGTAASFWLETWGAANGINIVAVPINAWVLLVIGFLAVGMGWPFGKVAWTMFVWMMDLALCFWFIGLGFLGVLPAVFVVIGGWLLCGFNVGALYFALAGHINTVFGPKCYLGAPIFK